MKIRVVMCLIMVGCAVLSFCGCSSEKGDAALMDSASSSNPESAIFIAASMGDVTKLKSLLEADPTLVDVYGPNGKSPLHDAAAAGQNAAVKYLLEKGADPLVADEDGNTAIGTALGNLHKDTAKIIEDAMTQKGGGVVAQ